VPGEQKRVSHPRIFPRNLTARAAFVVRGNPVNSRPESGVDNTHPGLEFDQRNLDKAFFPGLTFEFQYLHGARLSAIHPEEFERPNELTEADANGEIYLYYLYGAFGAHPDTPRLVELHRTDGSTDGYEVLRTVHDLEPGRVMVVIGTKDPSELMRLGTGAFAIWGAIEDPEKYLESQPAPGIFRDPETGRLLAAILVGERAEYLDPNGMISLTAVPPGDLTRSLCAPWQWDFADCGCHYWAANKPDIVMGPDGDTQTLNFQRVRHSGATTQDSSDKNIDPRKYADWTDEQMTQPQMISGWESLPFVIAERETDRALPRVSQGAQLTWPRETIVREFRYLATIEHALAVEYLYAFYSLKTPLSPPSDTADPKVKDIFTAAQVIRSIAVDEMRHFRWVNEALQLLSAGLCLERAEEFKQNDTDEQIRGKFELAPLTPERLRFFIQIEAPSKVWNQEEKLDGLYTRLLNALGDPDSDLEPMLRRRLREIVKLIIDEGHGHWERFRHVQELLSGYREEEYLRVTGGPVEDPTDPEVANLLVLADWNYLMVLRDIAEAFLHQPGTRNEHITDARRTMYNLDDTAVELAERGFGMRFKWSVDDLKDPEAKSESVSDALVELNQSSDHRVRRIAQNALRPLAKKT
jgi:hypothetical protein